jgi:hypothetical protein
MKKSPVLLSVALAALAVSACKKEVEELQNPAAAAANVADATARPALLSSRGWHQIGLDVSTLAAGAREPATSNLFGHIKPSMVIQQAGYQPDGTYRALYGATPGAPGPHQVQGTWKLNAAADSLVLTLPNHTQRFAVRELSATTLRLTYTDAAVNGSVATYTSVFGH